MAPASPPLTGSYDYDQVAKSVVIAVAASYVALDLAGRVTAAKGWIRLAWLAGGATAMGIGVWNMQLKAMLAFHLPVPIEYHWPTILAALLVAIFASAVALFVTSRSKMGYSDALTGSLIMGAGIAGLHYTCMAAMRLPAIIRYQSLLVACSILLAILFSLIALIMAFGLRDEIHWRVRQRLGSAIIMGAAISAMDYTGMAAASFYPSSPPHLSHAINISALGNSGVAIVTVIVLLATAITCAVDRKAEVEIRHLNRDLERRVVERTRQLESANDSLREKIAEHQRAEEALRQNEESLQRLIDTIPAMLYSASPDGAMDFFNKRWLEYLGLPLEQLTGWGWAVAVHPDDLDSVQSKWSSTLATGTPFEHEMRVRGADAQYRWFLIRKEPARDPQGRVVKWYGSGIDIEDRKRAEDELRRQMELFQKIFENAPVMMAFFDRGGKYKLVNPEWERITGWTLQEIREGNIDVLAELFPDPQNRQMILDRITASAGERREIIVHARNGSVLVLEGRVVQLSDGSRIAISRDITERKRSEEALLEAQEKLARITRVTALGELAVAIAHEVNQPLAAIVTNGNFCLRQLASGTPKLNEMQATITEIVDDGTRASDVISRIRGMLVNRYPLTTELDVKRLICDTILLLRNELDRNRVSLRTEIVPDLPHVLGDPVQLQQVLINLLMNAVEAVRTSRNGQREILIRSAKDADNVLVQVQDSGPGIDPEIADRIFEPFFTTKPEGIGMGLSISRSIVESHGGHLSFVRTSSSTMVQFTLPVSTTVPND